MTAPVIVSFGKFWNVRTAQAVICPQKSNDFSKINSEVLMRYLFLGVLFSVCSGLAWSAGDDSSIKSNANHANASKVAKANPKTTPKLTPAELANLATQKEIAQRRAALAASAAVVPTVPSAAAPPKTAPSLAALAPLPASASAESSPMPDSQTAAMDDVHVGRMVCELGIAVSVTPDGSRPGTYWVQMRQHRFHMTPVTTSSGAVRLEDTHAGAMWLQLPHKSMLMNSKIGQRMADECQSAHQLEVAARMKSGPPSTLLDGPSLAKK
jgi:hypothetical protein